MPKDFTKEKLEKFRIKMEEQQRIGIELAEKEEKFRKMSREKLQSFPIKWQNSIGQVDFDFLFSILDRAKFPNFPQDYVVQNFNLEAVLTIHCRSVEKANKLYSMNQLWDTKAHRNSRKTTMLIDYIINENTLCPPVIDYKDKIQSENEIFLFFDGNHRTALCRYLGIIEIPFIIKKSSAKALGNRIIKI